jgi:hypothetical protein
VRLPEIEHTFGPTGVYQALAELFIGLALIGQRNLFFVPELP